MIKYTVKLECKCGVKQELKRAEVFFEKVEKGRLSSCVVCSKFVKANYLDRWVFKSEEGIF